MLSRCRSTICVLLCMVLAGCGYHLVGTTVSLPEDVSTIYVERFENRSNWADMDQRLIEALTLEWVRRRALELVNARADADVVLSGVILGVSIIPVSFDDNGRASQYQMTLTAAAKLSDVRGDKPEVLWEDLAFSRRTSYAVDPNAADYFDRQLEAMDRVATEFSRGLVTQVLEGF